MPWRQSLPLFYSPKRSIICSYFPANAVGDATTKEVAWGDPAPILEPMILSEDKIFLTDCIYMGRQELIMVLIFNLGAATQATAMCKSGHRRDKSLNAALVLYQLMYNCIIIAQDQEEEQWGKLGAGDEATATATVPVDPPREAPCLITRKCFLASDN